VSRPARVGAHRAAARDKGAVEQHLLDPLVIVEILHVPQVRHCGRDVRVQVRRAMPGDLQAVRCRQPGAAEELGDAAAPRHV
jgi:hypothetical protein